MSRRLYYSDSFTTDFVAKVISTEIASAGEIRVELDESYFYPTSGGQMHDLGTLGGVAVIDVIEEDDVVWHVLEASPDFVVGDRVEGRIDTRRRAHHRQQHTGQHILSRILEEDHGLATESSRLGESDNTLDVAGTSLSLADLDVLEDRCDEIFWRGLEVDVHLFTPEEAAERGLRQKVGRSGPVRVVEVRGVDSCACGGTHVSNTAQIGCIAILSLERVSGGQRIHFLCGTRAALARRHAYRTLHAMAAELTCGTEQLAESLRRLKSEVKDLQRGRQQLAQHLVRGRAEAWIAAARPATLGGRSLRWVHRVLDEGESLAATQAMRAVTAAPSVVATFCVVQEGRGQLLVGRSADLEIDCRTILSEALKSLGGRGGGNAEQARGGFKGVGVERVLQELERQITLSPPPG